MSRTPRSRRRPARRRSWSPTMAAASSTARRPRSRCCRRSSMRSARDGDHVRRRHPLRQDVMRALALGAKSCMIGRAYAYGLGAGGQAGVAKAIDIIAQRAHHDNGPVRRQHHRRDRRSRAGGVIACRSGERPGREHVARRPCPHSGSAGVSRNALWGHQIWMCCKSSTVPIARRSARSRHRSWPGWSLPLRYPYRSRPCRHS